MKSKDYHIIFQIDTNMLSGLSYFNFQLFFIDKINSGKKSVPAKKYLLAQLIYLNFSCQLIHQKIYEVLKIISFLKIWIVIEKIVWHHCATLLSYLRLVYFCWLIRYFSPKKRNSDHFLAKSNWDRFLLEHSMETVEEKCIELMTNLDWTNEL